MRISATLVLVTGALNLGSVGCSERTESTSSGPKVSITVAPLELPLMSDVCYGLSVFNTAEIPSMDEDTLVWAQPNLCASNYGAEGGIRFTGICDAQAGGFDDNGSALDPDHNNTVMLVLNDIYTGGDWDDEGVALDPNADYINPCPQPLAGEDNGCILKVPCTANQDKKVLFNLTVMRDATLGFFDTVVKFQDVFCAAKLDCLDDDNSTLNYLHNPDATPPGDGPTAVLGFACLGGNTVDDNASNVFMYLDDIVISCTDGSSATVDPTAGPGNVTPTQSGTPPLFGAAVNTGDGFQGVKYWNVLLGLNLDPANGTCTLHTTGTVSETALTGPPPYATPEHTRYPFIDWTVTLSDETGRLCTRHPLNDSNSTVETLYTDIDTAESFDHVLALQTACPCWEPTTLTAELASIVDDGGTMQGGLDPVESYVYAYNDSAELVAAAFVDGATKSCYLDSTNVGSTMMSGISDTEYQACLADVFVWMDNRCASGNGGCAGDQPACVYDGPGQVLCKECWTNTDCANVADRPYCDVNSNSCVECVDNASCAANTDGRTSCETYQIYDPAPAFESCVECGQFNNWACATGQWCDMTGTCAAPPASYWIPLGFNQATDLASAQQACTNLGAYHPPSAFELFSAMHAQFDHGAVFFPGAPTGPGDTDHQFSPWRYYISTYGNYAVGDGGQGYIGGVGGSWGDFLACAPD